MKMKMNWFRRLAMSTGHAESHDGKYAKKEEPHRNSTIRASRGWKYKEIEGTDDCWLYRGDFDKLHKVIRNGAEVLVEE